MSRLFGVGEAVICVDGDFSWARRNYPDPRISYPVRGQRYVVRAYLCEGERPSLAVRGIVNPIVYYIDGVLREAGFWDRRFARAPLPDSLTSTLGVPEFLEQLKKIERVS